MTQSFLKPIPKVALIHDLCGYGNCSLKIAISVLSATGLCPLPLPTSLLSSHTAYPSPVIIDTTPYWENYLHHWESIGTQLEGSYCGFLGNIEQINLLKNFFQKNTLIPHIIDPVMGDHGRTYKTYSPQMCLKVKELIPYAHILTPNLTEASILTDLDYQGQNISLSMAKELCLRLQDMGAKHIILKGIQQEGTLTNLYLSSEGQFSMVHTPYLKGELFGTGDLFASIITSAFFNGIEVKKALPVATEFLSKAIRFSLEQPNWQSFGVSFEPLLYQLSESFNKIMS